MAGRFSVEAVFKAVDRMSNPVKGMTNSTSKFSRRVRRDFAKAQRSVDNFHRSTKRALATGLKRSVQVGIGALAIGLGIAVREFINFDQAVVSATAKFKDIKPGTEQAKKAMEDLRKVASKVGTDTQFTATQAAEGLDFLAMAGFTTKQAMTMLSGVADIATIANVDLARATDIASDALGAFGLATDDTAQLGKNFTRVQDVMAKTITSTNTTMEDLFEAIKFGGPAFTSAGQSMETFSAIAGRMASSGIKGSMAGTALRSAILRLQKPTKEVTSGLGILGLGMKDLIDPKTGGLLDMVEIMKKMEAGGKKLTPVQRNAALAAIVGKNAFSAWAAVLGEGVDKTDKLKESLLNSTGAAAKMSAEIRKSLLNRLKMLGSAANAVGRKFMVALEKKGGNAIDAVTKAIREFDPTPIIDGVKFIVKVIVSAAGVIKDFWPLIVTLTGIWLTYKGILIAVAIKQAILNAIMFANPVGLVIAAIAILIGLVITLYRNWDNLNTGVKIFMGIIVAIGAIILLTNPIGIIIAGIAALIVGFVTLVKHAGGVKNAFIVLGKIIMKGLLVPVNLVLDHLRALLFLLSKIPVVGSKFKGAFEAVSGFQNKINKPFEITEFQETKRKKDREFLANEFFKEIGAKREQSSEADQATQAPTTQRESFLHSFINKTTKSILTIQNNSRNDVEHKGRPIPTGSSVAVPASG